MSLLFIYIYLFICFARRATARRPFLRAKIPHIRPPSPTILKLLMIIINSTD